MDEGRGIRVEINDSHFDRPWTLNVRDEQAVWCIGDRAGPGVLDVDSCMSMSTAILKIMMWYSVNRIIAAGFGHILLVACCAVSSDD